jgi:site-specific DNA-methyltransferase (adenine-specific)
MSDRWTVHHGDCREVMRTLDPESIDSIVTDPPYGLSFMGKGWDHGVPGVEFWAEALRVVTPGAHLLAFGGTRTFHRLACAIEDAGWEIRDCVMWVYGSGFPKSHDVSKAIDREAGAEREVTGVARGHVDSDGVHDDDNYQWKPVYDRKDAPATEAAKQWQGWGTALKPAWEPIIVARKPLRGTVAGNVLEWGTGGINVDGCRIGRCHGDKSGWSQSGSRASENRAMSGGNYDREPKPDAANRWPANFIHDGSEEVGNLLGDAARFFYCAKASKRDRDEGCEGMEEKEAGIKNDSGRGFSESDPMAKIMRRNHHPTVKPIDLMRYLCRLVTPPDGLVLDPFTGSGSTGKAAMLEGFRFVGCELSAEYIEIARARIGHAAGQSRQKELALA